MQQDWVARLSQGSDIPRPEAYEMLRRWQRQMYEAGFVGLTWPKEAGGRGLTFMEEMILQQEMALTEGAAGAQHPRPSAWPGRPIIAYGTDEQKRRYPPKMLSCEEIWCQGYSEPNAGSDLASLQTRAVKDGDHYVINGQKVWTSLAHIADWMMLLARTDPDAPKHKGITYFLLDMKSPGITVKPLEQMTGDAEFNEVYFDNVRVHESQILGGLNNGWAVGLTTLMYERLALGFGLQVRLRIALDGLVDLGAQHQEERGAGDPGPGDAPEAGPAVDRHRGASSTRARARSPSSCKGELPGPEASAGKMMWVEGHQRAAGAGDGDRGPVRPAHPRQRVGGGDGLWQHTVPPLAGQLRSRAAPPRSSATSSASACSASRKARP